MSSTDAAPSGRPLRLLLVEDSEDDAALVVRHLERAGYQVNSTRVDTREHFVSAATSSTWDVVISDHSMPQFSSTAALADLNALGLDVPFIIVSGTIGEDTAVESMRAGAHDYILKNNLSRLTPALARSLADAALRRQNRVEREARKAVERQLQQAQRLEAIGRLAGGIAHDFNNLLTVILGFSELALERLDAPGTVRFEVDQVKLAAERAARLTRQLLAFSRQQVLAPRLVDPGEAIEQMLPMVGRLLSPRIRMQFLGRVGEGQVRVDPGQLEQVILNLAINARDAMPDGGVLTLQTRRIDLTAADAARLDVPPGAYIELEAADAGVGMDEETRSRIFEPFFTTKAPGEGTGLGLATVYGIVTQSAGAIAVESTLGAGTTFRVYFPIGTTADDRAPAEVAMSYRVSTPRGTILVVEPDEALRVLVRAVLANAGFAVLDTDTSHDAIARLAARHEPIALLLTEAALPGAELTDMLRLARARVPAVPVLFMGSRPPTAAAVTVDHDATDTVLEKPFVPEQLLARVYRRLELSV